jgi:hypothetical protein
MHIKKLHVSLFCVNFKRSTERNQLPRMNINIGYFHNISQLIIINTDSSLTDVRNYICLIVQAIQKTY